MAKDDHSTVDRVANILEYTASCKKGLTFSEIMRSLIIPKSSLHPLLHTLCKRRFLRYRENDQRYFLGDRIFSLGAEFGDNTGLLGMIDDALSNLAISVRETCYFGVLAGNEVLYILKQTSSNPIQVASRPGSRLQAYASAIGKSLLSQFNREELVFLYPEGLTPITANTVTDIDNLCKQLDEGRKNGFFYEREESSLHIQCVAMPVFCNQKITAALSVAFPIFTVPPDPEQIQRNREKLAVTCEQVEKLIERHKEEWI